MGHITPKKLQNVICNLRKENKKGIFFLWRLFTTRIAENLLVGTNGLCLL